MQNSENKDKILKIFSRVHCFSQDQLPRYVNGRLTHIEKHLLEQHLVNCELCSDAVEILQKPKYNAQYFSMGQKVQQLIRSSKEIAPVYETERYQKKVKTTETFLTYFWSTVAVAMVVGFFFIIAHQTKDQPMPPSFAAAPQGATAANSDDPDYQTSLGAAHTDTVATKDTVIASVAPADSLTTTDPDQTLYKTAMNDYFHGHLDEAIPRFTKLTTDTSSRYRELAHYQLGMCYRYTKQKGKARQVFKDLVNMNGRMKKRAQLALIKL